MNASTRPGVDHYLAEFARVAPSLPGQHLPWLKAAREAALGRFARLGFPGPRDEDWKYTSLAALERLQLPVLGEPAEGDWLVPVDLLALPGAHVLVFLDGVFQPELSRLDALPGEACRASSLAEDAGQMESWLAGGPEEEPAFDALNRALWTDGAYIRLPKGCQVAAPIHLLFLSGAAGRSIHVRNRVVAEAGSSLCLIEHHAALGDSAASTNAVTQVVAGEGAQVIHHKLQEEGPRAFHLARIQVEQDMGSRYASFSFAFGGALARVDLGVRLAGQEAACTLDGLYLATGRQLLDHHTRIDHFQPRGGSRQRYKGVLAGASRAVFNGKVVVHPGAWQSDAFQFNRNLLLSENAEVDTKPELEIHADEVKCGHGATVGELDPEQIFYLRSRGMDADAARGLLVQAFAREIVDGVEFAPLQDRLYRALAAKLGMGEAP